MNSHILLTEIVGTFLINNKIKLLFVHKSETNDNCDESDEDKRRKTTEMKKKRREKRKLGHLRKENYLKTIHSIRKL